MPLSFLNRLKHGGKEPSHMPGHIYGTAFLKTSRIVNHLSHLRITWKLTCLLIVNFVILFMCKSCLLSSLFFIAPWALCRVDLAHYKSYELLLYYILKCEKTGSGFFFFFFFFFIIFFFLCQIWAKNLLKFVCNGLKKYLHDLYMRFDCIPPEFSPFGNLKNSTLSR